MNCFMVSFFQLVIFTKCYFFRLHNLYGTQLFPGIIMIYLARSARCYVREWWAIKGTVQENQLAFSFSALVLFKFRTLCFQKKYIHLRKRQQSHFVIQILTSFRIAFLVFFLVHFQYLQPQICLVFMCYTLNCSPSASTMSEDRTQTVAMLAMTVRHSNHSARSHPHIIKSNLQ